MVDKPDTVLGTDNKPELPLGIGRSAVRALPRYGMGPSPEGRPALFELLTLEGCQAGLSWITVLRKREHYRKVYDGFDPGPDRALHAGQAQPGCWPIPALSAIAARSTPVSATPRPISRWSSAKARSPSSCGASSTANRGRTGGRP